MDSNMELETLDDLVTQAERMTADISGEVGFPRVERNLKQLAEAGGQQLWTRTARGSTSDSARKTSADVRASVLLGPKGYDLQKVSRTLENLSGTIPTLPKETSVSGGTDATLDLQSFLRNEREKAILTIIEDVKKSTIEKTDQLFRDNFKKDWDQEKLRILNATFPGDGVADVTLQPPQPPVDSDRRDMMESVDRAMSLIREHKNYSQLLGYMSDDGCRVPGSVDRGRSQQEVDKIVSEVANACEKQGFLEESVILYDLCGNHSRALDILNKLLAGVVPEVRSEGSPRDRLEALALRLAERYTLQGHTGNKSVTSTFFLLLDIMTFFAYYHRQNYRDALDTIEKLSIVPFVNNKIDLKVQEFNQLSEEVRRNIPEILLASMNILHALVKEIKSQPQQSLSKFGMGPDVTNNRDQQLLELRQKARSLITYAGMIPYRMPGDVNSKLVQLEVLMN